MPVSNTPIQTHVHTTTIRRSEPIIPDKRRLFAWGEKRSPARKPDSHSKKPKSKVAPAPAASSMTVLTFATKPPVTNEYTTVMRAHPAPRAEPPRAAPADRGEHDVQENFRPLTFGERMLRNTAVCVAVLLCAIALKSIDAPIAQTVSSELRQWVTMDLDESLGSLKFVQNLIPDAALVFWHIGSTQSFAEPAAMTLAHSWSESEPYLAYVSAKESPVTASAPGEVMSVTYAEAGTASVRIRHDGGLETLYGNLSAMTAREGDTVETGQVIGSASALYFEIRGEGRSMNPAPLMAAKP